VFELQVGDVSSQRTPSDSVRSLAPDN